MGSEVIYRKWRPQTLAEIVGQEPVTQTLRHAVENGKIAHAYLFCGPRGTGKTSTGRVLAKAVNCPHQVGGEPCNSCDMCRSITGGMSLDVVEMDAASNRGIDDIRSLREKVNYAPGLARYKVYIVDEVHMLTDAACNALLKTLEEPPPRVIFVMATTEPHKVLSTIVSRCQRFNFRRLSRVAITDKLRLICQKEGFRVAPEALRLIAQAATGSLRDAENILEQSVAYHGNQIDVAQVQSALGLTGDSRSRELAKHIVGRDISGGLRLIHDVSGDGVDLRQFNRELVEHLRDLLLVKSDCKEALDLTQEDLAETRGLVADVSLGFLLTIVKRFSDVDFRSDSCSALPLELALVDSALSLATVRYGEGIAEVPQGSDVAEVPQEVSESLDGVETPEAAGNTEDVDGETGHGFEYLKGRWREFVQSLKGEGSTGTLDAFLRSACEPIALEDETLVLGFYYSFHKEKIEDPKYRYLVERKLEEVFGRPYKIRCALVDHKRKGAPLPEGGNPLVKAALEMGAEIRE